MESEYKNQSPKITPYKSSLRRHAAYKKNKSLSISFVRKSNTYDERLSNNTNKLAGLQRAIAITHGPTKNIAEILDKSYIRKKVKDFANSVKKTQIYESEMENQKKIFFEVQKIMLETENLRLKLKENALLSKNEGEIKKFNIIKDYFDTISCLMDMPFNTSLLQIKAYDVIGEILMIYKDFKNAAIYFFKGVFLLN